MEEIITQLIQSQGIWAVLFVFLLLYTIKLDELQDAREKEYQKLLLQLTDKLAVVNAMNDKLDQLCNKSNETKL